MCSLGVSLRDSAVDSMLWPRLPGNRSFMPTYKVGDTECMVMTRDDATSWVLYCHGNAVTLSDLSLSGIPAAIVDKCRCNFIAPDYPLRVRKGKRYDDEVIQAVRSVYDELCRNKKEPVYVMGRSIGVGVALAACEHRAPAGLGLVSGFASIKHMAPWALRWIVDNRFDNTACISHMKSVPKLLLHGDADTVVPVDNVHLLACAGGSCTVEIVPRMTHLPDQRDIHLIATKMAALTQGHATPVQPPHYSLWQP